MISRLFTLFSKNKKDIKDESKAEEKQQFIEFNILLFTSGVTSRGLDLIGASLEQAWRFICEGDYGFRSNSVLIKDVKFTIHAYSIRDKTSTLSVEEIKKMDIIVYSGSHLEQLSIYAETADCPKKENVIILYENKEQIKAATTLLGRTMVLDSSLTNIIPSTYLDKMGQEERDLIYQSKSQALKEFLINIYKMTYPDRYDLSFTSVRLNEEYLKLLMFQLPPKGIAQIVADYTGDEINTHTLKIEETSTPSKSKR